MPIAHTEIPSISLKAAKKLALENGVEIDVSANLATWPILPLDHPERRRQCDSKSAYLHLASAIVTAVRHIRLGHSSYLRVYACPFGLHLHLTSKREPPRYLVPKGIITVTTLPDVKPARDKDAPYVHPRVEMKTRRDERVQPKNKDATTLGSSKTLHELASRPPSYELSEVELSAIFFDHYCREPVEANLNRLRNNWQLEAVGTIYVSRRPGGSFALIEGRHRVMVAMEKGVTTLPARIYNELSYEQEAALYNLFNVYSPHSAIDRLKGRLEAKVPKVLDMTKIIRKYGLDWNFDRKGSKGHINAAATIENAYDTWGPKVLAEALSLLNDAWGLDTRAFRDDALAGAVQFVARYGGHVFSVPDASGKPTKFDRSRMVNLMRERGIRQFRSEAVQISLAEHLRRSHSFGRAMRSIYNLHLRNNQLPQWPDRIYSDIGSEQFKDRSARGWKTRRQTKV